MLGPEWFGYIIFGFVGVMLLWALILGRFYPGSGADQVNWKPTRSDEVEAELALDDVDQMLEAQNERRRKRGLSDRTLEEIEAQIAVEERERLRGRAS
jgi:hypothetical protein